MTMKSNEKLYCSLAFTMKSTSRNQQFLPRMLNLKPDKCFPKHENDTDLSSMI